MKPENSFRLFKVFGITVYLHWFWFLLAYYQIIERRGEYSSVAWNVAEYVVLFAIVLLHEFGHSLATRQVGGTADTILLWPLGGVAYVNPPNRAGAQLWAIAAGPLVNVVLLVPFTWLSFFYETDSPDIYLFFKNLWMINTGLIIFNILPIYPLDGGQILRSLLWFKLGANRSLLYASMVGFVGVGGLVLLALYERSLWLGIMALYVFDRCRTGYMYAKAVAKRDKGVIDI